MACICSNYLAKISKQKNSALRIFFKAVTKSLSGKCFQLFPWENTGLDQTKLIIIFEIPEPKGPQSKL